MPPVRVVTSVKPVKFCTTPLISSTIAETIARGSRSRSDAAHQIDPEVAERSGAASREPANEGDGDRDADRGGDEVLHRETSELHRVAQSQFGRVRLPVRVRHERDRGVEREPFGHGRQAERVGQHRLEPLQGVDEEDTDEREDEHPAEVRLPGLLRARSRLR